MRTAGARISRRFLIVRIFSLDRFSFDFFFSLVVRTYRKYIFSICCVASIPREINEMKISDWRSWNIGIKIC